MLKEMKYDLVFNRKLKKDHHILPGGYNVKIKGKSIDFNFEYYQGTVDENIPTILHVIHMDIDKDKYPDAAKISVVDIMSAIFNEFHVSFDESQDVYPVAVRNLVFNFDRDILVYASHELLNSADLVLPKKN